MFLAAPTALDLSALIVRAILIVLALKSAQSQTQHRGTLKCLLARHVLTRAHRALSSPAVALIALETTPLSVQDHMTIRLVLLLISARSPI